MKFIKWLKSEMGSTPSPFKNRSQNTPASSGKKPPTVTRTESYLKALAKFNKWRQAQLKKEPELHSCLSRNEQAVTSKTNVQNPDKTYNYYEEIDNEPVPEPEPEPSIEVLYYDTPNEREVAFPAHEDEDHIYSTPLPEYNQTPTTSLSERELYNWRGEKMNRMNVPVTDLDKSQEFLTAIVEENLSAVSTIVIDNEPCLGNLKSLTEVMICRQRDIKFFDEYPQGHMKNFFIRHGEVYGMDITFIEMKDENLQLIFQQSEALRKLRHPHVIALLGITNDQQSKLNGLILESTGYSLYDRIYYRNAFISLETCYRYTLQLTNALEYLQARGIIHSNVCSETILITPQGDSLKLGGFELATMYSEEDNYATTKCPQLCVAHRRQCSTYFYQAPELISTSRVYITPSLESDTYGICLTLWEMLNCVIPYMQYAYEELLTQKTPLEAYQRERQQPFAHVLDRGLQMEPEKRFRNAKELKQALKRMESSLKYREPAAMANHSTLLRGSKQIKESGSTLEPHFEIEPTPEQKWNSRGIRSTPPQRKYNVNIMIKSIGNVSSQPVFNRRKLKAVCKREVHQGESILAASRGTYEPSPACQYGAKGLKGMDELPAYSVVAPISSAHSAIATEDFYIDDDNFNIEHTEVGANFQLEFDYEFI